VSPTPLALRLGLSSVRRSAVSAPGTAAELAGEPLLKRRQPFAVVAEIMGWSPATSVTMAKRYGHIGDSVRRQAMTALETRKPTTNTEATDSALAPQPETIQCGGLQKISLQRQTDRQRVKPLSRLL